MNWIKKWVQRRKRRRVNLICCHCGFKEAPARVNNPAVVKFCDAPRFDYFIWECFRCEVSQITFLAEEPEFVILGELARRGDLDYSVSDLPDEAIVEFYGNRFNIHMPVSDEPDIEVSVAAFGHALESVANVDNLFVLL